MAVSDPGGSPAPVPANATTTTTAPRPKSPPKYPDICGRHRLQVEVQILNREIGFLEEELQSLEDLQPASRCCKEVNEIVGTKPDPLVPVNRNMHRSCRFWKWLRANLCFNFEWVCCCSSCCSCKLPRPSFFCCCRLPKNWSCCHCDNPCHDCCCLDDCCCCWEFNKCCCRPRCCCVVPTCSCPEYSCGCVFSCPKCTGCRLWPRCNCTCCASRCLCP